MRFGKLNLVDLPRKHGAYLARNPQMLPRIARSYWKLLVRKEPVLRGVELAITYNCQARCRHCLQTELIEPGRREFTISEIERTVAECMDAGALYINITGGEPLLRPDLLEVIPRCRPDKVLLSIATNGILLGPMVDRLWKAGIRMVTVSMDSSFPDAHDEIRCFRGNYKALREGVDRAKRAGMKVFLNTIATRENIRSGDLLRMSEQVRAMGDVLTVNLPYQVGAWRHKKDAVLDDEEMKVYFRLLKEPHVRWEGTSNYLTQGCPAGTEKVYISPYGDVFPCAVMHVSVGNVREKSFVEIYREMRRIAMFKGVNDVCLVGGNKHFRDKVLQRLNKATYVERDPAEARRILESVRPEDLREVR
jgi:MoaA/NifB/PqqE/SkfB family radical SAM enzyme